MIIQPIQNIAEICARHDIRQAVLCPGSRSAPITLAFARHPEIDTLVIPDERSAGFIGLGLAQASLKPVVLVCTSGTAAANLYPAIIEAYYRQIPLLVLTADRPPEWIDQQDGQTIRQQQIYQNHVLASYQFPVSFDHEDAMWHSARMISEAINMATADIRGPVHINVPIREPFYPLPDEKGHYGQNIKIFKSDISPRTPDASMVGKWQKNLAGYGKILIVAGQGAISDSLLSQLNIIQEKLKWPVIGDITSNVHTLDKAITRQDFILDNFADKEYLLPDLVITFGQSTLSKKLKQFLRSGKSKDHWHIGQTRPPADIFKSLTNHIIMDSGHFFEACNDGDMMPSKTQTGYFDQWTKENDRVSARLNSFFDQKKASEFHAVQFILQHLSAPCVLHLANSMPVRYASMLGLKTGANVMVHSNRGTSGIDGCVSTAVGHAINTDKLNILLIGDMAFFYDRNALWHRHLPDNLRIVILNNHGGGIFRLIDGPKSLEERETYFATHQALTAENTARDFKMNYYRAKNLSDIQAVWPEFLNPAGDRAILEIETDPELNRQVFEELKDMM